MLVAAVQPSLRSLAGEQLLRKRRDAPLLSDMARETKRTRPCVALAVHHIASNDDLMAQAQAVSNYHSLVYATGSLTAKDSHLALQMKLCHVRGLQPFPMTCEKIHAVGTGPDTRTSLT